MTAFAPQWAIIDAGDQVLPGRNKRHIVWVPNQFGSRVRTTTVWTLCAGPYNLDPSEWQPWVRTETNAPHRRRIEPCGNCINSLYVLARQAGTLADEDLSKWKQRHASGRYVVGVGLAKDQMARLEQVALRHERPLSYEIRKAVDSWLDQHTDAATETCPRCGGDAGDNWFDRTLCPCNDALHTRCVRCGAALDGCPLEDGQD